MLNGEVREYLEREGYIRRRMEEKGLSRKAVEAELKQMEKGVVTVGSGYERAVEEELKRLKGDFVNGFLELEKKKLGAKFERERDKLAKEGAELWDRSQQGKETYFRLEERSHVEIMDWKDLEKQLRMWLENEARSRGWTKNMIENTVNARKREFEHAQAVVKARIEKSQYSEEQVFRKRMLNPATRKEAIQYFLRDNVDKQHYLVETISLIFDELEQLRRRR